VGDVPSRFTEFFQTVFTTLPQSPWDRLKQFIEASAATYALIRTNYVADSCPSFYNTLGSFMLGTGLIRGNGAYTPLTLCQKAAELWREAAPPLSCKDATTIVEEEIRGASPRAAALTELPPNVPRHRYAITASVSGSILALARFANLPRQTLLLEARLVDDRPRITSFGWVPIE
jgi:hypothetical protein